jgi:hypothetical protein
MFPGNITEHTVLKRLLTSMLLAPVYNLGTAILELKAPNTTRGKKMALVDCCIFVGKMLAVEFAKILILPCSINQTNTIPILQDVNATKVFDSEDNQIGFSHNPALVAIVIQLMIDAIITSVLMDLKNKCLLFCFGKVDPMERCSLLELVKCIYAPGSCGLLTTSTQGLITATAGNLTSCRDSLFYYGSKKYLKFPPLDVIQR